MATSDQINKLLEQAKQALQQNRPKVAIRATKEVLKSEPQNAPALFMTGMAEAARGRSDVALNFIEMASKADPNAPEIQFNLGVQYGLAGRTVEAENIFADLKPRFPNDVNIIANLGRAQYSNAKWMEAARSLEAAAKLAPGHSGILEQLGASLQQGGDHAGAERAYQAALKVSPGNPDVHFNLGTVRSRRLDIDGALGAYKQALRLKPDHPMANRNLSHLLTKAGRFEEALEPSRHAHRVFANDPGVTYDLGYALAVTGRTEEALKVLRRARITHPDVLDFTTMAALAHFRAGDAAAALELAEEALESRPGDNTALAYKAMALNELGRVEESRPIYDLDRLITAAVADAPDGFDDISAFNSAFVDYIRAHDSLVDSPLNRSLKGGQSTRELLDSDDPAAVGFKSIIGKAVEAFRNANPVDADHPFLARRPEQTRMACWANIIRGGGFQDVHFHPTSWLSGVYYPKLPSVVADPDRKPEGWLEFGRAYYMLDAKADVPVRLVRPEEGLIVIFPAYFGHRTIPFDSDAERISVAFDVMPADSAVTF